MVPLGTMSYTVIRGSTKNVGSEHVIQWRVCLRHNLHNVKIFHLNSLHFPRVIQEKCVLFCEHGVSTTTFFLYCSSFDLHILYLHFLLAW